MEIGVRAAFFVYPECARKFRENGGFFRGDVELMEFSIAGNRRGMKAPRDEKDIVVSPRLPRKSPRDCFHSVSVLFRV